MLVGTAYVVAKSPVTAAGGTRCSSAWRAANGSLSFGGERTDAEVTLSRDECRAAGEPVMRAAYAIAVAGVAVGAGALAARRRA